MTERNFFFIDKFWSIKEAKKPTLVARQSEMLVCSRARSCVMLERPCVNSLGREFIFVYFHAHGRALKWHGRA